MRFKGIKPSGKDADIPVFEFAFGPEEMNLLIGICKTARMNMPDMFEFSPMKARLLNIIHELEGTLCRYKKGEIKHNKP